MLGLVVATFAASHRVEWKTTNLQLGQVKAGVTVPLTFELTNSGSEPLTILEAKGSCGCTSVSFSREPIAPGSSAQITANFSSSKTGAFKKHIQVKTSAADEAELLYFSGEVVD